MNIYTIYKSTNKITGKSYIGFDSCWPRRKSVHKHHSKKPTQKFHNSINKHGWDNFEWEIIYQSLDGKHCLNEMENYFIQLYDTFANGYNMTLGGEGTLGKKSWLGKKHTQQTKDKIKAANTGKTFSEEHKQKLSNWQKGKSKRPFSEEHKKKISESLKKKLTANLV